MKKSAESKLAEELINLRVIFQAIEEDLLDARIRLKEAEDRAAKLEKRAAKLEKEDCDRPGDVMQPFGYIPRSCSVVKY